MARGSIKINVTSLNNSKSYLLSAQQYSKTGVAPNVTGATCACGKVRHRTRQDALDNARSRSIRNIQSGEACTDVFAYKCPECGDWHITSTDPSLTREDKILAKMEWAVARGFRYDGTSGVISGRGGETEIMEVGGIRQFDISGANCEPYFIDADMFAWWSVYKTFPCRILHANGDKGDRRVANLREGRRRI